MWIRKGLRENSEINSEQPSPKCALHSIWSLHTFAKARASFGNSLSVHFLPLWRVTRPTKQLDAKKCSRLPGFTGLGLLREHVILQEDGWYLYCRAVQGKPSIYAVKDYQSLLVLRSCGVGSQAWGEVSTACGMFSTRTLSDCNCMGSFFFICGAAPRTQLLLLFLLTWQSRQQADALAIPHPESSTHVGMSLPRMRMKRT